MNRLIIIAIFWAINLTGFTLTIAQTPDCPSPARIAFISFEELDSISLSNCSYHQFILLIGAAQQMGSDTAEDIQIKADICFSLIADELQKRSKSEGFDPSEPGLAFVIKQLEAQQYHLALTRPSDWEKLGHYAREGRWAYIARRFMDRGYLPILLAGILIVIPLSILFFRKNRKRNPLT